MVLASGGVLAELVGDSRTLLLPADADSVMDSLASLKLSTLIAGFRGRPAGDWEAVVDTLLALAGFAEANSRTLEELEINPLLVLPRGVMAVDVLMRLRDGGAVVGKGP